MILAIYGTGGGGKETLHIVQDIQTKKNYWDNIVFIDDTKDVSQFHEYNCYPYDIFKKKYNSSNAEIHVALGEIETRKKIINKIENDGFKLATIIHPKSKIGNNVKISKGVQIKMGAIIEDNVIIGKGSWIQAYAHIKESVHISEYCQISAKAIIQDNSKLEKNVFIGMHASIAKNLFIKQYAIISMGANVLSNILTEQVCMGNPARVISLNKKHRVF